MRPLHDFYPQTVPLEHAPIADCFDIVDENTNNGGPGRPLRNGLYVMPAMNIRRILSLLRLVGDNTNNGSKSHEVCITTYLPVINNDAQWHPCPLRRGPGGRVKLLLLCRPCNIFAATLNQYTVWQDQLHSGKLCERQ